MVLTGFCIVNVILIFIPPVNELPTTTPATSTPTTTSPTLPPTTTAPQISVSITPVSGTNTAGEIYSLECSATVTGLTDQPTGSTDQPTITWLDDDVGILSSDPTRMVSAATVNSGGSYFSILTFTPLATSDAGRLMCRVTLGGMTQMETTTVSVNSKFTLDVHIPLLPLFLLLSSDPNVTVTISNGGATPNAGQSYTLTCSVSGANNFNPAYQWRKDSSTIDGETEPILSFTSLMLVDAGEYTCQVTVSSSYLNEDIIVSNTLNVTVPSKLGYKHL